MEKLSRRGVPVDLTTSLADQKTTDFCLVRKDSELHGLHVICLSAVTCICVIILLGSQGHNKAGAENSVQATLTSLQYKVNLLLCILFIVDRLSSGCLAHYSRFTYHQSCVQ